MPDEKDIELPEDSLVAVGDSLKAVKQANGSVKLGGYLIRYSDPHTPDLAGDFFTKDTEYGVVDGGSIPLFYNHGYDGTMKNRKIGRATIKFDDVGMWLDAQLEQRDEYEQMLAKMAADGKMGLSSGAAGHLVEREMVGKAYWIKTWIVAEGSLTPTPAEPRNSVMTLKAFLGDNTEPKPEAEAAQSAQKVEVNSKKGVNNMELTDEKLQEIVTGASEKAAQAAVKAFVAAQPSEKEPTIEVVADEADNALKGGWKFPGEFFMMVKTAGQYPGQTDARLLPLKATGLNEAIPSQGGFLVPPQVAPGILENLYTTGSLLAQFPRDPVTGNSMTYNIVDETSRADGSRFGGIRGYWMAEGGIKTQSKPSFRQLELKLKKIAALCVATDELLEDAAALQSWLVRTVPQELRFMIEDAIVNGNGVGKPVGILSSPALKQVTRINATSVTAVDIGNMWAARYAGANDYLWLASPSIFPQLLNMSIGNMPMFVGPGGLGGMPYSTLLGKAMVETEYNPTLGEIGDLLLVSPSAYPMIEKSGGVQSASSIHVYFTTDEQAFRFVYRIDGAPSWVGTLTKKDGTTVSPFVALTTST